MLSFKLMNTKLLSEKALSVIDQYVHFHIPAKDGAIGATTAVPYFNNRRVGLRGGLRSQIGKGSPRDIFDEVEIITLKEKINTQSITDDTFKKVLVDHNVGIDCSGLVYYVLNAESIARKKGTIDRHLAFTYCTGLLGKIKCKMRPAENTDVLTLAHEKNSHTVEIKDVQPGDMITMLKSPDAAPEERARDHVLLIHQVEYQNFIPLVIKYTHAMAWPSDGMYGHGVRQGTITVTDPTKPLIEQQWLEAGKTSGDTSKDTPTENYTLARAKKSITEIRRLKFLDESSQIHKILIEKSSNLR